jgi:hypothetical protein
LDDRFTGGVPSDDSFNVLYNSVPENIQLGDSRHLTNIFLLSEDRVKAFPGLATAYYQ